MKKTILLFLVLVFFTFKNQAQVTDYDGNVYDTTVIGSQTWLTKNLKVIHYRNGDIIRRIYANSWDTTTTGAYGNYNDNAYNGNTYGRLYNWYTVSDSRGLCPIDYHIPSYSDISELIQFLGGSDVAGGKIKNIEGDLYWNVPNTGATNETGFNALGGGGHIYNGSYMDMGIAGYWWTSYSNSSIKAYGFSARYNSAGLSNSDYFKKSGFSVRCVKANSIGISENNYINNILIFPIPAEENIIIKFNNVHNIQLQIINIIGECVLQKTLLNDENKIDISSLSKGIYIIKLNDVNWTVNRKMTKL